jgi:UDP-glucose:(heptosyl)LPS alpha-1,3-glucosyltransferase
MSHKYPIRVAVVIPKYGLIGGAESVVFEVTERLAEHKDFEIHVFANKWRQGKAPLTFNKVPIIPFPRWIRPISFAYFSKRLMQSDFFDIVHSHERIFEMDLLTFHGIPHEIWTKKTKKRSLSLFDRSTAWVEKKGMNHAKGPIILPVSNLVKDELLKLYNIPKSKLRVIHPGVSLERFSSVNREDFRYEIRQRHGLSLKDVVVLFVSMNFELKRLDLLLKSISVMVEREKKKSNLKLMVVGKGDEKRFKSLARDVGISNRVVFVGVTREVEKYYLAADIFAMPSRFDTFGLVVLEAMAAGLPVIISRSVGAKDLVKQGHNGFILSEDPSISEMATSLSSLLEPEKRKLMGENGRRVARLHSWDKTAERVADLYRQLAERNLKGIGHRLFFKN